jgi:predicted esterase
MPSFARLSGLGVLGFMFCLGLVPPASADAPAPLRLDPAPRAAIPTRADMAQAYLRLEHALRAHPPAPSRQAEVQRRFDAATQSYFSQNPGDAARDLSRLAWDLQHAQPPAADLAAAMSLRARIEPRILALDAPPSTPPSVRIQSLYDAPEPVDDLAIRVELRAAADGSLVLERAVSVTLGSGRFIDASFSLGSDAAALPAGAYELRIVAGEHPPLVVDRWFVAPTSLDARRDALLASIDALPDTDASRDAASILRARVRVITGAPSLDRSIDFITDPLAHLRDVEHELAELRQGRDPYRGRPGDLWRTINLPTGGVLPVRVFAPSLQAVANARPARTDQPAPLLPLVIAMHGAGGDEHMFMQGYGSGQLRDLAQQHGFLAVAPSTIVMASDPHHVDVVIDDLARHYPIDRDRVYLVGHSLGAIAASKFAAARPDVLAAAACIAGFDAPPPRAAVCPMLLVAADLDPIFPLSRMTAAAEAARAVGQPVELRVIRDAGHTLVVNNELAAVVQWLLAHRRGEAPR